MLAAHARTSRTAGCRAPGHVADDVDHRQQVLVVDRLLAHGVAHGDELATAAPAGRRRRARRAAAARRGRPGARPAAAARPAAGYLLCRRARRPRPRRRGRRAASRRSPAAARRAAAALRRSTTQQLARRRRPCCCRRRRRRPASSRTRARTACATARRPGVVGPVDLRDDRREHRRSRRHFDHLHVRAVALRRSPASAGRTRVRDRVALRASAACLSTRFTCRSPTSPPARR